MTDKEKNKIKQIGKKAINDLEKAIETLEESKAINKEALEIYKEAKEAYKKRDLFVKKKLIGILLAITTVLISSFIGVFVGGMETGKRMQKDTNLKKIAYKSSLANCEVRYTTEQKQNQTSSFQNKSDKEIKKICKDIMNNIFEKNI